MFSNMKQKIQKSLPPLPEAAVKIAKMARDPDVSVSRIAEVLSSDPILAAKVLRVANSSFFGLSRKIGTVKHAVVVLGALSIRNLAMCASVASLKTCDFERIRGFWRHALATAIASRMLAGKVSPVFSEEYFLAGLLHDIGKLALLKLFGDDYAKVACAPQSPACIRAMEMEAIGVDHAAAGADLGEHWQLPQVFCDVLRCHHLGDSFKDLGADGALMASTVATASSLAILAGFGCNSTWPEPADLVLPLKDRVDISYMVSVLEYLARAVRETEAVFEVPREKNCSKPPVPKENSSIVVSFSDPAKTDMILGVLSLLGWRPGEPREAGATFVEISSPAGIEASPRPDASVFDLDSFVSERGFNGFEHTNLLDLAGALTCLGG
ncbi:MAG: HDOD domain-containing protein [Deltaproteobacteria bacterium]|nr:HDOD domain-containing protein [Deltaproteobacteria bacterium]